MSAWPFGDRSATIDDDATPDRPVRRRWAIVAATVIGLAVGLGGFTFVYARGASYLTNDPEACGNCHIMREHLDAWVKSSHHAVAVCNDCHTPHNFVGKYVTKARNGFWHSFYFTTGRFPDPLRITEGNRGVTEGTCRYCHGAIVDAIDPPAVHGEAAPLPRAPVDSTHIRRTSAATTAATSAPRSAPTSAATAAAGRMSCIRCHRYVGHLVR